MTAEKTDEVEQLEDSFLKRRKALDEKAPMLDVRMVDFDVVQEEIGNLGRYQFFLILVVYLAAIPAGLNMVGSVFLEATPDHRCALPPLDNHPYLYPNLTEEELKNYTIPFNNYTQVYDQCHRYNYNLSSCDYGKFNCITPYPPTTPQMVAIPCDHGYRYSNDVYINTVATEWNLVCSDSILKAVADSVFFMGIFVGALLGGSLADRFGRIPMLVISQLGAVIFGVACTYSPTFIAYVIFRFLLAIFIQAGYLISFVYAMEITGDRWRTLIGISIQIMFTAGEVLLSLGAIVWRDWRDLQFHISLFPVFLCWLAVFVPESPRWLFSKGKYHKGRALSELIAMRNGYPLPRDVWIRAEEAGQDIMAEVDETHYSPLELFKRPRMRLITCIVMLLWGIVSLVYYGITLNVAALPGDIYSNSVWNAVVEPIVYVIIIAVMDKLGRRFLTSGSFLITGVACLVAAFAQTSPGLINNDQGLTKFLKIINFISKMSVAGSFSIIANYTAELYPTVLRSTGVGIGSMAARVGGSITPFALYLQRVAPWLPGTIFGVSSLGVAMVTIFLPETRNKPMLTSLEEAEVFYRKGVSESESKLEKATTDFDKKSKLEDTEKQSLMKKEGKDKDMIRSMKKGKNNKRYNNFDYKQFLNELFSSSLWDGKQDDDTHSKQSQSNTSMNQSTMNKFQRKKHSHQSEPKEPESNELTDQSQKNESIHQSKLKNQFQPKNETDESKPKELESNETINQEKSGDSTNQDSSDHSSSDESSSVK